MIKGVSERWHVGTSLVVQWLRHHVPTAGGVGLIPGGETKISHAMHGQKMEKKKTKLKQTNKKRRVTYRHLEMLLGFLCGSVGKESTCNTGNLALIPGSERSPGEEHGYRLQYSESRIPESPWTDELGRLQFTGQKESDKTEWLST